MTYKLFIDDERFPVTDDWVIARSTSEAIGVVMSFGVPNFISFDHDLGGEDTSMKFIHWLINFLYDAEQNLKGFDYYVHSQNPIGKDNIEGLMNQVINEFKG